MMEKIQQKQPITQQLKINNTVHAVRAFAPATSANFAVGFDLIGFAIEGVGDRVKLTKRTDDQLVISKIYGVKGAEKLPLNVDDNVCSAVIQRFLQDHGLTIGFDIEIEKGIGLGSGIGGSAASAVGAILALNEFLQTPLSKTQLIDYAIFGESLISGGVYHGDNAVPCMFGGLILLQSSKPCSFIKLPTLGLYAALSCPDIEIETKAARVLLHQPFDIQEVVAQNAKLAATISALYTNDLSLLKGNLMDVLVEPMRKVLIPGFDAVKKSAISAGAIGCGISGSGPAVFAVTESQILAQKAKQNMHQAFVDQNCVCQSYVTSLNADGAYVEEVLGENDEVC
ncbi:homoserine kinase [Facilibium subflavum]|uniref:homoserine kinase n=1 Tax=Facilibium subflavum TaxID=2219058 RepID=UPI001F19240D|nr:homoserine kinase [Facilibium subflavum]